MIVWLASYPKSGNTLLRSMLSGYLFSQDGKFNFDLLKNIRKFPDFGVFRNLGIDITNEKEVVKNYLNVQKEINKRDGNSVRFLKTHSALNDINGHKFTDLKNTLGAIYIVRDPRKVVVSYANHSQISLNESLNRLMELRTLGGQNDNQNQSVTHVGSWSSNYHSWKEFKKVKKYLLVKYEDLISDPENFFLLILEFIHKLSNTKFVVDKNKLKNVLDSTTFENLQSLEKKNNFPEAIKDTNGNFVTFFKYGKKNTGKNLPIEINDKIEKGLNLEMKELGYL
tara:strand:- start:148 stop:993 length:846 start_codon:yes stop_codon:yes gene_type:complete